MQYYNPNLYQYQYQYLNRLGIDPFTADDPMQIYQNILSGKIRFSSSFDADAKSLVRHLVEHDLSKRYGNLKNGKCCKRRRRGHQDAPILEEHRLETTVLKANPRKLQAQNKRHE